MKVTTRLHWQSRIQESVFIILVVVIAGLVAWLSTHYNHQVDWTLSQRHTLSTASEQLLAKLTDPVTITVYAGNNEGIRGPIKELIARYQRFKSDIHLRFVDPYAAPNEVRERGIQNEGELVIDYQGRVEHIRQSPEYLVEADVSATLQRIARTDQRTLFFLEGHGERNPTTFGNHDLSEWEHELTKRGFDTKTLNLAQTPEIPRASSVLVIANPQTALLPPEVKLLEDYIEHGGNLLWLLDPEEPLNGLEALANQFRLSVQTGTVIEPNTLTYTFNKPFLTILTGNNYAEHPVTQNLPMNTLFPYIAALEIASEEWDPIALFTTSPQSWLETGDDAEFTENVDVEGPFTVGFALSRLKGKIVKEPAATAPTEEDETDSEDLENEELAKQQRVIIMGDGDFLSNTYLNNGGNLDLSLRIMDWLALEDAFIDIPAKITPDVQLKLSSGQMIFLGLFFLFILPIGLISIGVSIWLRRRKV